MTTGVPLFAVLLAFAINPSFYRLFEPERKPRVTFTKTSAYRAPVPRNRLSATIAVFSAYLLISILAFWSPEVMDSRKGPGAAAFIAGACTWYGYRSLFDLITRRPRLEIDETGLRGGLMKCKILWSEVTHLEKKTGGGLLVQTNRHSWPPTIVVAPNPADREKAWELIERLRRTRTNP